MIQSVKKRDDLETKIKIDRAIWEFCGNPVNIMDCIGAWNIKIEHFDSIRSMFSFGFKFCKDVNACSITVEKDDINFSMRFYKGGRRNLKMVGEFLNVPQRELKATFEQFTGLEIVRGHN